MGNIISCGGERDKQVDKAIADLDKGIVYKLKKETWTDQATILNAKDAVGALPQPDQVDDEVRSNAPIKGAKKNKKSRASSRGTRTPAASEAGTHDTFFPLGESDPAHVPQEVLAEEDEEAFLLRINGFLDTNMWTIFRMDPETEPPARGGHACALVDERMLFVYGGVGTTSQLNDIMYFDIYARVWNFPSTYGDMPPPRTYTAAAGSNRAFFVHGGGQGSTPTSDLFVLDISTWEWHKNDVVYNPQETTAYVPIPRMGHLCVMTRFKMLIVWGGYTIASKYPEIVEVYETVTRRWLKPGVSGEEPRGRVGCQAAVRNGDTIIFFGGVRDRRQMGDLFVLHVKARVWTDDVDAAGNTVPTCRWSTPTCSGMAPQPRIGHCCAITKGGAFLVYGGACGTDLTNEFRILDTHKWSWSRPRILPSDDDPPPLANHSGTVCYAYQDQDGKSIDPYLLLFGGQKTRGAFMNQLYALGIKDLVQHVESSDEAIALLQGTEDNHDIDGVTTVNPDALLYNHLEGFARYSTQPIYEFFKRNAWKRGELTYPLIRNLWPRLCFIFDGKQCIVYTVQDDSNNNNNGSSSSSKKRLTVELDSEPQDPRQLVDKKKLTGKMLQFVLAGCSAEAVRDDVRKLRKPPVSALNQLPDKERMSSSGLNKVSSSKGKRDSTASSTKTSGKSSGKQSAAIGGNKAIEDDALSGQFELDDKQKTVEPLSLYLQIYEPPNTMHVIRCPTEVDRRNWLRDIGQQVRRANQLAGEKLELEEGLKRKKDKGQEDAELLGLNFTFIGNQVMAVEIELRSQETILAESETWVCKESTVVYARPLGAIQTVEKQYATFTNTGHDSSSIVLTNNFGGKLFAVQLSRHFSNVIILSSASNLLCCSEYVKLSLFPVFPNIKYAPPSCQFLRCIGPGTVIVKGFSSIMPQFLHDNQTLLIDDMRMLVAFEGSLQTVFVPEPKSGSGYAVRLSGPGTCYLQTAHPFK
eukprot:GILK01009594.1.p1 GENE.GILK01009594.1~~GILK01009594.1.p1  ORF type:complete len:976 (-),score=151.67 GILK01009594.1:145-3072(-)